MPVSQLTCLLVFRTIKKVHVRCHNTHVHKLYKRHAFKIFTRVYIYIYICIYYQKQCRIYTFAADGVFVINC